MIPVDTARLHGVIERLEAGDANDARKRVDAWRGHDTVGPKAGE